MQWLLYPTDVREESWLNGSNASHWIDFTKLASWNKDWWVIDNTTLQKPLFTPTHRSSRKKNRHYQCLLSSALDEQKQTCESPPEIPLSFWMFFRFAKNMLQWSDFKYHDMDHRILHFRFCGAKYTILLMCWGELNDAVDGRNPAPVDRWFIPVFMRFYTSQVVQDFSHQLRLNTWITRRWNQRQWIWIRIWRTGNLHAGLSRFVS